MSLGQFSVASLSIPELSHAYSSESTCEVLISLAVGQNQVLKFDQTIGIIYGFGDTRSRLTFVCSGEAAFEVETNLQATVNATLSDFVLDIRVVEARVEHTVITENAIGLKETGLEKKISHVVD